MGQLYSLRLYMSSDNVELEVFKSPEVPSFPALDVYPPAISLEAYPPPAVYPAALPSPAHPNHIQLDTSDFEVRVEAPNYETEHSACRGNQRLVPPVPDPFCVVGTATLSYSSALRAYFCGRLLLPHLVDGHYHLEMSDSHIIAGFATQTELQQICDHCSSHISSKRKQVSSP